MTPTQRSLKMLRDEGWTVEVVEKWNPHSRTRHDLFGFADLIAIRPGRKPLLVQVTSGTNTAARVTKIEGLDSYPVVLACGFDVEVHGWRKLASNRNRWTPKIVPLTGLKECLPMPCDT